MRTESSVTPGQSNFSALFAPLKEHINALDGFLRLQVELFEPEIRDLAEYCIDTSGKRIRPALVFFSGWIGPKPTPEAIRLAAVVEMVHLATLVHDDVMDGAHIRRNRPTAGRKYGPEASILLGDALLAHAVCMASEFPSSHICRAVSEATRRVCAGEIIQTLRRGSANLSISEYFRVIDLKTAELFRLSCELGAQVTGAHEDFVRAAGKFGRQLGVAYQIYDDLADFYGKEARIGKTLGTDLKSGKPTLPLLLLLERLPLESRTDLVAEIEGTQSPDPVARMQEMSAYGIFSEVENRILAELQLGRDALSPWLHTEATQRLLPLCEFLQDQVQALRP